MTKQANDEMEETPGIYYTLHTQQRVNTQYTFSLFSSLKSPEFYAEMVGTIINADENDLVFIHLNSPGGSYYSCLQIQNAIAMCQATTIAVIHGQCASAASAIALACDHVDVMPFADMLVHNATYGFFGKSSDNLEYAQFNSKQFNKWLSYTYEGFLTPEEIDAVEKGKQHYMDADEIEERLQKREEYYETKAQEALVEHEKLKEEKPKRTRKKAVVQEAVA